MPNTPAYVHQAAAVLARNHKVAARNEYGSCIAPGYVVAPGSGDRARVHHQLPPVDFTDPDRPDSWTRWVEMGERVAEYATTLETAGWTVEQRQVLTGPILLAVPPAPPSPAEELATLLTLADPLPTEMRRTAELTELVHGDAAARVWWERAAAAGNYDAIGYLKALVEEGELTPEETGERENSLLYWLGLRTDDGDAPGADR
jgi:hypothetical protein